MCVCVCCGALRILSLMTEVCSGRTCISLGSDYSFSTGALGASCVLTPASPHCGWRCRVGIPSDLVLCGVSPTSSKTVTCSSGHIFLNPFLPRVTTVSCLFSFSHLSLFLPLVLFCCFLFFLPLHLDYNLNVSSWVLGETRSLEKADAGPQHWLLGYFGDCLLHRLSVWVIYSVLAVGNRQCRTLGRNVIHGQGCPCPHPAPSTFCSLNPTPVGWRLSESGE